MADWLGARGVAVRRRLGERLALCFGGPPAGIPGGNGRVGFRPALLPTLLPALLPALLKSLLAALLPALLQTRRTAFRQPAQWLPPYE